MTMSSFGAIPLSFPSPPLPLPITPAQSSSPPPPSPRDAETDGENDDRKNNFARNFFWDALQGEVVFRQKWGKTHPILLVRHGVGHHNVAHDVGMAEDVYDALLIRGTRVRACRTAGVRNTKRRSRVLVYCLLCVDACRRVTTCSKGAILCASTAHTRLRVLWRSVPLVGRPRGGISQRHFHGFDWSRFNRPKLRGGKNRIVWRSDTMARLRKESETSPVVVFTTHS